VVTLLDWAKEPLSNPLAQPSVTVVNADFGWKIQIRQWRRLGDAVVNDATLIHPWHGVIARGMWQE
jgi:hypothetical protein